MKIVLCGPPKSGKSCLREGLKQAIRRIPDSPYPYVITACPDGEGAWFQETANRDPEEARNHKDVYKACLDGFSPEFVKRVADSVANCKDNPLVLVDIGGIPSAENESICSHATHAILLAGDLDRLPEWYEFCRKVGLRVIAEIHSDYTGKKDIIPSLDKDGIWRGSVHYLERGELIHECPTVRALAETIVDLVADEGKEERMATYSVKLEDGNVLRVGFGEPAQNDQIVKDAGTRLDEMVKIGELAGGPMIKINGPASLPVAIAIAHAVGHLYEVIGVFDPKLGKYVVAVSHGTEYQVGDLID